MELNNLSGITVNELKSMLGIESIAFRIGPKGHPFSNTFSPSLGRVVNIQVTEGFDHKQAAFAYNSQNVDGVVVLSNKQPVSEAFTL